LSSLKIKLRRAASENHRAEYAAPDGAKNILIFVSTNMSRLRRWQIALANFCPERDNLKIARSFNCGLQSQKFPRPAGAAENRAQKLKAFSFIPSGLAFFGLLSRR
jgi:hypothetical protein